MSGSELLAMTPTFAFEEVVDLLRSILTAHGYAPSVAQTLATNCASAQRDGSVSHGIFRMHHYLSTVSSGYVDGHATPILYDVSPGLVRVDACNEFAQPAIACASALLVNKARHNGIAALAVRNSHHLGALYLDVEAFATQGLIALALVNSAPAVAPPGARKAVYGTNPIAFAVPRVSAPPWSLIKRLQQWLSGMCRLRANAGTHCPPAEALTKVVRQRPTLLRFWTVVRC